MNRKIGISGIVLFSILLGCNNNEWKDHYNTPVATVNTNVWEAILNDADLSQFAQYVRKYDFDSLFIDTIFNSDNTYTLIDKDNTYTIFAPTNYAFSQLLNTDSITSGSISYLISSFLIQSGNVKGKRKIETFSKKFAILENSGSRIRFDDVALEYESPLYLNGKYFRMNQVAWPKPNLYEYISATNPVLKSYIDSQDSIILDKELSRPIGFDAFGNTIYDTVSIEYNKFEAEFFKVSEEFRFETATLVFPKEEDYNNALTVMALSLGGNFTDYKDISLVWQKKKLIPYLLEHGVFENMVEPFEFTIETTRDTIKMKNILGDSIIIDYQVTDKSICSNGYAYNYTNFVVPDTLFASRIRYECEDLLQENGTNRYKWFDHVLLQSDAFFEPKKVKVPSASNDTILNVDFNKNYSGAYTVEFNIDHIFPRKYLVVMRTYTLRGGIYNIYVNNVLVKNIDYYKAYSTKVYTSVVPGKRYNNSSDSYNFLDFYVENLTEYGQTNIKFEYLEPGRVSNNGLTLDYVEFIPQK